MFTYLSSFLRRPARPSACKTLQAGGGTGSHVRDWLRSSQPRTRLPASQNAGGEREGILKVRNNYTFYCQSCGELIIKTRTFYRILPLPSENWSSLVEEWCCHPDPFANRSCLPKVNDCFLGDTFILLNKGNISDPPDETNEMSSVPPLPNVNVLKSKENTKVVCKRCKAMLGEKVSSDVFKYFFTEIIIQPLRQDYKMISRMQFLESIIVQLLLEHSSCRSTFRFCIEGPDGKHFLLLWLLNSDTLLMELSKTPGNRSNPFFSENTSVIFPQLLEAKNAIRLLYLPCSEKRNKELADKWMNNTGAHSLIFPLNTCLELVLLLSVNNSSLPYSLRFMNDWQVAYLKM
ncbi:hypothetical protein GDO86_009841 [Hymenochirus boettgeri]|uniref:E3 ubiquitin-protein ligase E3D n=1 Tax=Hymenochirus boettgeri TaxID=247094 RepID=A0A8T2JN35_9PIPI|nr:hypothetical protein GDO86_009841 [Hymenochirus boettgeri]